MNGGSRKLAAANNMRVFSFARKVSICPTLLIRHHHSSQETCFNLSVLRAGCRKGGHKKGHRKGKQGLQVWTLLISFLLIPGSVTHFSVGEHSRDFENVFRTSLWYLQGWEEAIKSFGFVKKLFQQSQFPSYPISGQKLPRPHPQAHSQTYIFPVYTLIHIIPQFSKTHRYLLPHQDLYTSKMHAFLHPHEHIPTYTHIHTCTGSLTHSPHLHLFNTYWVMTILCLILD